MCPWNRTTILMDLVLAIVINTSATLLAGAAFMPASWYMGTCTAFATNVFLQLVLPVPAMGQAVSRGLHAGLAKTLVSVFIENLVFVTCISLTMTAVQTGGNNLIAVWISTYVQLTLIGYVTSVILFFVTHAHENNR